MNESFENALEFVVGLNLPQRQLLLEQNITDDSIFALLDEAAITDLFTKRPLFFCKHCNETANESFPTMDPRKGRL